MVEGGRYITINDQYKDPPVNIFRESKKGAKPVLPFVTTLLPNNAENGKFSKLTYSPSPFKECIPYLSTQPLDSRQKGFGTHDAHKVDEFTMVTRAGQHREHLAKESSHINGKQNLKELISNQEDALQRHLLKTAPTFTQFPYGQPVPQFDLGRTVVTPFDPKATRDHYYKYATDRPREVGPFRPTSANVGRYAWECDYKPPELGTKKSPFKM